MHEMSERARIQQAAPSRMPVPLRELPRVEKGSVSVGEMGRWALRYVEENPGIPDKADYEEVANRFIRLQEATDAVRDGNRDTARSILEEIVASKPEDLRSKMNLSTVYIDDGEHEKALSLLDEIGDAMKREARYYALRALALKGLGKREEMIKFLWEAQELFPQDTAIMEQLQKAGEIIPMGSDPNNAHSIQFMKREHYENAVYDRIQKLVAEKKWNELDDYVVFQRSDQKPKLALAAAEAYRKARPNDSRSLYLLGLCELDVHNWAKAEKLLGQYLEEKPDDPKAIVGRALAIRRQERKEEAMDILQHAIKADPNNLSAVELATLGHEKPEERLEFVQRLEKEYPDAWAPQKALGDLMYGQGAFETARVHFERAVAQGGSDECWVMLLNVLGRLGQVAEAVQRIQTITRLHERSSHVRWNAANLLLQAGRVRAATDLFNGLLNDPKQPWETRHAARTILRNLTDAVNKNK